VNTKPTSAIESPEAEARWENEGGSYTDEFLPAPFPGHLNSDNATAKRFPVVFIRSENDACLAP
jgi:hypothetical protein